MEDLAAGLIHLEDMVTISAYASSMGGSQVFLAEGEHMTLEDLLKCTIIASANDAAVALAEYVSGSESAFVTRMNERAKELGATTANFENATGLDDDTISHVMSALDIAIISKELVKHSKILEYSSVWMDSIRNGEFTLTNTNRLIRYYDGATGLKTGSTDKAKFCMTATAERNQMPLIAVIMGAESRDARNNAAKSLLDWGFANFALYEDAGKEYDPVQVKRGEKDHVSTCAPNFSQVVLKTDLNQITKQISLTPFANAAVEQGSELGKISYLVDGEIIGTVPIYAKEAVSEITFWGVVGRMLKILTLS
jgi:D-alanyl-D-alanine carboxypeptidase (penicillin-binding protein 5/6)